MASHNLNIGQGESATVACTAVSTTTDQIALMGCERGSVQNTSGGAITINWYAAHTDGGTALVLKNTSNAAVTQTIANNNVADIPAQVFSAPYVFPVLGAGTASIVVYVQ